MTDESSTLQNIRSRHRKFETFRTPDKHTALLLDYAPEWFVGRGVDPSAGDGRMIRMIRERGNRASHILCEIRREERSQWADLNGCVKHIGDYLEYDAPGAEFAITNPPFTLAQAFVTKALNEVSGKICILQSVAFQGTRERSKWLKNESHLEFVLNLPSRPKWEVDGGDKPPSNVWDFAWFVFDHRHSGLPTMDWLL